MLIVLISMRYSIAYPIVFRYLGFAVSTVLIRLALTAPRFIDAGLGITAAFFAVALTWIFNQAGRAHFEGMFDGGSDGRKYPSEPVE